MNGPELSPGTITTYDGSCWGIILSVNEVECVVLWTNAPTPHDVATVRMLADLRDKFDRGVCDDLFTYDKGVCS